MTKLRAPLTFENALTVVAALLGWPAVAALCKQSERTVRNWSDPDTSAGISLEACLALDEAYMAAGGDGPPFHLCYALRIEAAAAASNTSRGELIAAAGRAAKEAGEAVSATLTASRPDASPGDLAIAERELEESIGAQTTVLAAVRQARGSQPQSGIVEGTSE